MAKRVVALVALLMVTGAGMMWARNASKDSYPATPEGTYFLGSAREFHSLGELAATSDLVIRGHISSVDRGLRTVLSDGSGDTFTARLVRVTVDESYFSRLGMKVPAALDVVDGYWSDGIGFQAEGMPWARRGEVAYYFLEKDPSADMYSLVHAQGRVLLTDHGPQVGGTGDLWGTKVAPIISSGAVDERVRAAADSARSGASQPVPVSVCRPTEPENEDSAPICDVQE